MRCAILVRMRGPERYFFVHLQKTAGTSLTGSLRDQFGPGAVYPLPGDEGRVEAVLDVDHLQRVFAREQDRIRVVAGHFPLCTTEVIGVPFRTFTILREPLARTLSFLRHQQVLVPELADASLDEVYNRPKQLHALIHNHMVKMLGLTPELMTHGAATMASFDDAYLERAKAALDRIDVWGLQEDYDGFHRNLEAAFGWDLGPPRRSNTTTPGPVSEELAARILRDNALDVELYRYATDHVQARFGDRLVPGP